MAGRTFGFAASFAIPLVLARTFTPAEFGVYRQIFLLYATLFGLAQVGMAESLYFFVPQDRDQAGRAVANALLALIVVGALAGILLCLSAHAIGRWMGDAALPAYIPALALFLGLMLPAVALEIVMVSRERYTRSALVYGASDVVRSGMLSGPALAGLGLGGVMEGAIGFALARLVALVGIRWREFGRAFRPDATLFRRQLAYAIPFAGAVTLDIIQLNYHQYAVASWFDPATFAVYSVGCLQIPLVDLLSTSAGSVMMVTMGRDAGDRRRQLAPWLETVERLVFLLVPFACILALCSREVIVTLYREQYAAAAPVFTITAIAIALTSLPTDSVLRAYAETRFLFILSLAKLLFIALTIAWFVRRFGLPGAVMVTVIATAAAKVAAVWRVKELLEVPARRVLPWRRIIGITVAALVALVPARITRDHVHLAAPFVALAAGSVYALTYAGLVGLWWSLRRAIVWPAPTLSNADRS